MDIEQEKLNLQRRELNVRFEDIFSRLKREEVSQKFAPLKRAHPHTTVFEVARSLAQGGYDEILNKYGFYSKKCPSFEGRCHQSTPALGLVLNALGFKVAYLEGYRIKSVFEKSGILEQVPPSYEENDETREEFCAIGRIPYCALEVIVEGEPFLISSKHVKAKNDSAEALLSPVCYRDFIGVFSHQADKNKSGMYLDPVVPPANPANIDFLKYPVWKKQAQKDERPELFATYLRMNLE